MREYWISTRKRGSSAVLTTVDYQGCSRRLYAGEFPPPSINPAFVPILVIFSNIGRVIGTFTPLPRAPFVGFPSVGIKCLWGIDIIGAFTLVD